MEMERNHEKQRQDEDKARQRYGHYNPARQGFYLFPSLTIIAVIISLGVAIHGLQSRLMKVTDTHNSSRRGSITVIAAYKTLKIKKVMDKKMKQNRPVRLVPQWIRMRTDNTIGYSSKRRH
ncbi:unnamed protein product [Didymodactylos carnosus]|uniref:Large ribosomal subunit protein eL39 n=1 Tax=Didymodactylos carnosus TaxID=1234261 RepID=A0A8S2L0I6_9BILA|nr:unnamed protein product [Didymodactylos carnosus]CAF3878356.1 unnamed protein product [Didymodactylos carnosus]